MQRRLWVVAALVTIMAGCGNERNGYHPSKTFPPSKGTTITMGRPGDHWVDTMQFVRVARAQHGSRYGYQVTYEAPGGTTFTLFWSRNQIDFRGALPGYRFETMPFGDGRLLYPDRMTRESLPNVYQAVQIIEDGYARDADGAITAAEMFGIVAALGSAAPAAYSSGTRIRRGPPRARPPSSEAAGARTSFGPKSLGAAQRVWRTLQTGGNTLRTSTAKALNEAHGLNLHRREWGRALEALKAERGLPNNFHGRIIENGNVETAAGKVVGNLLDYIP